jgi:hypothetical protein
MRYVLIAIPLTAIAAGVCVFPGMRHPSAEPLQSQARSTSSQACPQCQRLSEQIDSLQRNLVAVELKLASLQSELKAQSMQATGSAEKPDSAALEDMRAVQAADDERNRTYMAAVAQSFNNEKVNVTWATQVASRVNTTLGNDAALQGSTHSVDCRQDTCRVQIEDDGSGRLKQRLPSIIMHLGDVLPTVSAEQIDTGNGHRATVLYMSSQSSSQQLQSSQAK